MNQKKSEDFVQKQFLFDQNKCVACHACVVGCQIENQTAPDILWRTIEQYNPIHEAQLPFLNLSIACNHCADAPCLANCPALAYSRDGLTGAIDHNPNRCIGCQYCTWVCPYEAPIFNKRSGIIEKCTFCKSRQSQNLEPACVVACPTGALKMEERVYLPQEKPQTAMRVIEVVAQRKRPIKDEESDIIVTLRPPFQRIKAKNEWPLVLFTTQLPTIWAWFTASVFTPIYFNRWLALGISVVGLLLSLFHLGQIFRAYRAIANVKKSWLSREILSYGLFVAGLFVQTFSETNTLITSFIIIAGAVSIISVDMVYIKVYRPTKEIIHSAQAASIALLLLALFSQQYLLFAGLGIIKAILFANRYSLLDDKHPIKDRNKFSQIMRLDLLFGFPLIFLFFQGDWVIWAIGISVILGEILDRIFFYNELKTY